MFDAVALTAFIAPIANMYCFHTQPQKAEQEGLSPVNLHYAGQCCRAARDLPAVCAPADKCRRLSNGVIGGFVKGE